MAEFINITLMRHGQTQGGDIYRGCTNDRLTELGMEQMYQATDLLLNPVDKIISSSLLRCCEFSQKYSAKKKLNVDYKDSFQEINFGQWEAKDYDQINKLYSSELKQYYQDPYSYTPPDAESMIDFEKRVIKGWHEIIKNTSPNSHVLVVTHGGVIRMLLHKLLEIPFTRTFNVSIGHGCLIGLKVYPGESGFVQMESLLGIGIDKTMAVQFMKNNINLSNQG